MRVRVEVRVGVRVRPLATAAPSRDMGRMRAPG